MKRLGYPTAGAFRANLAARLRHRIPELEDRIYASVNALPVEKRASNSLYAAGVRASIREVILLAIAAIEAEDQERSPPLDALAQARRAARSQVPVETVLRRYAAGERAFIDVALSDEALHLTPSGHHEVRAALGAIVDWVMASVAKEYELEEKRLGQVSSDPRVERIRRLLSGEITPESVAGYPLNVWHVAMISKAPLEDDVFGQASRRGGLQRLVVGAERGQTWAWVGARSYGAVEEGLREICAKVPDEHCVVGRGEPRFGLDGFCLSHRESRIPLEAEGLFQQPVVRGLDAVLAVAALRDPNFVQTLKAAFLEPLDDAGASTAIDLRRTLAAYLKSGQNATNAAAVLGVERRTVARHLRICEQAIGRPVEECHAELKVALDIDKLLLT